MGAAGNLYGTADFGGSNGYGAAFELAQTNTSWTETVLHGFCGQNCAGGSLPLGGLAMNAQGTLIGFANDGGIVCTDTDHGPCGLIYSIVPDGTASRYTVLCMFGASGRSDHGANPANAPVLDRKGDIYGTTLFGAADREGVLFRFAHGKLDVPHTFGSVGGDGLLPEQIIRDRSGHMLGVTTSGGSGIDASGTVFEWTPLISWPGWRNRE